MICETRQLRVRDFAEDVIASGDDRLGADDTILHGHFLHRELRRGLFLHLGDAVEERAFTVLSEIKAGLSCVFFLEGEVGVSIGDRRFAFAGARGGAVDGTAIMSAEREPFRRETLKPQHVRHLVISATPEWLDLEGLEEARDTRLLTAHLTHHRWPLAPRMVELIRQIFRPPALAPALRDLYLESRAVEVVLESIAAMLGADRPAPTGAALGRADMTRLTRAKEMIAARLAEPLSVEMIAREAGVSASGLQRLFRAVEGRSLFDYVRRLRLDRAFTALRSGASNVQEASAIAGYASPANFATAFRREFGTTPRAVMAMREG